MDNSGQLLQFYQFGWSFSLMPFKLYGRHFQWIAVILVLTFVKKEPVTWNKNDPVCYSRSVQLPNHLWPKPRNRGPTRYDRPGREGCGRYAGDGASRFHHRTGQEDEAVASLPRNDRSQLRWNYPSRRFLAIDRREEGEMELHGNKNIELSQG